MTADGFPLTVRWFRLLLRLYPADFRDDVGSDLVQAYVERAGDAFVRSGLAGLASVWLSALADSLRNGLGERLHPAVAWRRAGDWGRDLERAGRRLRRTPLFAVSVLAAMTVGLGAFAVVYTAVDKILLEPLPYRDPGDLYMVWFNKSAELPHLMVTGPQIVELRRAGGFIQDAAGMTFSTATLLIGGDEHAERVDTLYATENLFDLLGVKAALGRTFRPGDGMAEAEHVVVLTDGLWRRLGANTGIIGRTVTLSSTRYTVVGVMPAGFQFAASSSRRKPEVYIAFPAAQLSREEPTNSSFLSVVRARRGTSAPQFQLAVEVLGRSVVQRDFKESGTLIALDLHGELIDDTRAALVTLSVAAALLVLALTVNLAALLMARAAAREREYAVARALGAGSVALTRATVLEGALLGLAGGAAGSCLGAWGTRVLVAMARENLPLRDAVVFDVRLGAVVTAVGFALGVAAAAVPAGWMAALSLNSLIAGGGVRGAASSTRLRRGLVVAQIGVSLVLLTTGALVIRSFERLLDADPGFRSSGVLTFSLGIGSWPFPEPAARHAFQTRLEDVLRAIPGVTAVGAANQLPLSGGLNAAGVRFPEAPGNTGDTDHDGQTVMRIFARAGYMKALGMRVVAGRDFITPYRPQQREAIIDTHLARRFFSGGDPLGARIDIDGTPATVVGVAEQARLSRLDRDDENPHLYVRAEDYPGWRATDYAVRTTADPVSLARDVIAAVRRVDPRVAVSNVRALDDIVAERRSRERISAVLVGSLSTGALLLVSMGVFGVISGSVVQRRGELAVRLALGATHRRIIGLVVGDGARLVVAGTVVAVPGIYLAGTALRAFLIGVSPFDAVTLGTVTIGLAAVALLACYAAARPVVTIQPDRLLRDV